MVFWSGFFIGFFSGFWFLLVCLIGIGTGGDR